MYLRILLRLCGVTSTNPKTSDDPYQEVKKMLCDLHLTDLMEAFILNGIQDTSLVLSWSDMRSLLEESGIKRGPIYEIKVYLSHRHGRIHHEGGLSIDVGELLPPSAFVLSS